MKILAPILCGLLCFSTVMAQSSDEYEPFNAADYPADRYEVKTDSASFLTYTIEFKQVRSLQIKPNDSTNLYCRAWAHISNKGKITNKIFFKYIEPVGSCSGLFFPDVQPRADYFIFSKFGDYNGLVFILDSSGKLTEKSGGPFYISADQRYLFSPYDSDMGGITVFDFNKKKVLYAFDLEYHTQEWYYQDGNYFALVDKEMKLYTKIKIATFDLNTNQMVLSTVDRNYPKAENQLKIYNNYSTAPECSCGKK
ncbi:MAG: hypothetical protein ACKOXB_11190 [Flavobacteriales bacterium]